MCKQVSFPGNCGHGRGLLVFQRQRYHCTLWGILPHQWSFFPEVDEHQRKMFYWCTNFPFFRNEFHPSTPMLVGPLLWIWSSLRGPKGGRNTARILYFFLLVAFWSKTFSWQTGKQRRGRAWCAGESVKTVAGNSNCFIAQVFFSGFLRLLIDWLKALKGGFRFRKVHTIRTERSMVFKWAHFRLIVSSTYNLLPYKKYGFNKNETVIGKVKWVK